MTPIEISDDIRHHFHLFWDHFPFPVMLVHKSRTILDRNRAAEAIGCTPGTRCIDQGDKEMHRGCLAGQALREQTAKRSVVYIAQQGCVLDSYWIPLDGREDVYVHFGIDISQYAADHLFPSQCAKQSGTTCSACIA